MQVQEWDSFMPGGTSGASASRASVMAMSGDQAEANCIVPDREEPLDTTAEDYVASVRTTARQKVMDAKPAETEEMPAELTANTGVSVMAATITGRITAPDGLNLRSGPGTNYGILTAIPYPIGPNPPNDILGHVSVNDHSDRYSYRLDEYAQRI